jgi:hypothetical protein
MAFPVPRALVLAAAISTVGSAALGCTDSSGDRRRGTGGDAGPGGAGADSGDSRSDSPRPSPEVCNGVDDDRDGTVDNGCGCSAGATQACWPGDPGARGRGVCTDGAQTCVAGGEFGMWGACEGAFLPRVEIEGNCIDEDCDGNSPGCATSCGEIETCGNGIDDDCDGRADCEDTDCGCEPPPDCTTSPELCSCEDRCVPGVRRFCDEPTFCAWGTQYCGADMRWGACTEVAEDQIPEACRESDFPIGGFFGITYDPGCCVEAGECCQNYGHDATRGRDESIGNCAGIAERVCTTL